MKNCAQRENRRNGWAPLQLSHPIFHLISNQAATEELIWRNDQTKQENTTRRGRRKGKDGRGRRGVKNWQVKQRCVFPKTDLFQDPKTRETNAAPQCAITTFCFRDVKVCSNERRKRTCILWPCLLLPKTKTSSSWVICIPPFICLLCKIVS